MPRCSDRPQAILRDDLDRRAARVRTRLWRGYLALCREAGPERYEAVERDAWCRLQARLAMVDEELERARDRAAAHR